MKQSRTLSVCRTIFGHTFKTIVLNFFVLERDRPSTATLNFDEDPNPYPDPELRII